MHPFTRSSQSGTLSAILHESPVPIGHYASEAPESARVMLEVIADDRVEDAAVDDARCVLAGRRCHPDGLGTRRAAPSVG